MTQKTLPTDVPVEQFLATLDARRSAEGVMLVELFGSATGTGPIMWGLTMIGFGEYAYRYATRRDRPRRAAQTRPTREGDHGGPGGLSRS